MNQVVSILLIVLIRGENTYIIFNISSIFFIMIKLFFLNEIINSRTYIIIKKKVIMLLGVDCNPSQRLPNIKFYGHLFNP